VTFETMIVNNTEGVKNKEGKKFDFDLLIPC
jgi:hypothetical protein